LRRFRHTWVLVLHSVFFPTWIMNMVSFSTFSARSKAWLKISSVSYPSILTTANFTRIEASTLTSVPPLARHMFCRSESLPNNCSVCDIWCGLVSHYSHNKCVTRCLLYKKYSNECYVAEN
jgi:hypothetical protein